MSFHERLVKAQVWQGLDSFSNLILLLIDFQTREAQELFSPSTGLLGTHFTSIQDEDSRE